MSKKVADVIVEILQSAGVKRCYGIVGDTLNRVVESIEQSEIEWVSMRHEEAGAFAASAEAQLSGELVACAGSCGPGSLHFINGIYEANRNRAPIVLIASQLIRQDLGFQSVQEVDFKRVYDECSVYCDMILNPEQARRKTVAACQAALAKQGVAVLIVPADVSSAAAANELPYSVHVSKPIIRPNDNELDQIAAILNEGSNITIYGGSGCMGAQDEVMAVAAKLAAPIARTSRGKDALEPNNPYDVGMTGVIGNESGYRAVLECDTLLLLGADFAWSQFYPSHAKIIQIDIDPLHLGRRHPVTKGVVGDIKETLAALLPRLKQHDDTTFRDAFVKLYKDKAKSSVEKVQPGKHGGGISGIYLASLIDQHTAEDALFSCDDGTAVVWSLQHIHANGKRRFFASLLHGTMAAGMPSAIGLQKRCPDRQVIAICGDGGFGMLMGDLMTIVQENLPIKLVVFNNGKFGFVEIEQKAEGMVDTYTHLKNPDFGRVAEAVGLWGRKVEKVEELEQSVTSWLAQPGPALLDVIVNPMELVMPPFIALEPTIGMALYTAKAILHGKGGDVWEMVRENFP
ncbi:MAG: ubiquinone-dependent pyruvate dehydrogenase [Nitrosomonas sp.]|nr:ubiquinone-dependent pyruvate dehydrogenase [Nitrosomonas sp.]MBP7112078.1 ubiquinone-dependent pyruvate dehydrogenase [Nitrosomonas sp.]